MSAPLSQSDANTRPAALSDHRPRKILFASAHSIVDFSNGASVATLDVLQGLTHFGFGCHAFCTPKLDLPHEACFERIIAELHEPYQVRDSACGPYRAQLLYTRRRDVPITVMRLDSTRHGRQRPEEVGAVLEFFRTYLDVLQPDVMLTYGGDPITAGMIEQARRRGIPVVFAIHNLAYRKAPPLTDVDARIVASEFARRHYRDRIGLDCHALPNPVDWDRVRVEEHTPRFVTFVNPAPEKGAGVFTRIAHEMGRRRPDIPFLVVESRGNQGTLAACGLGRDEPVNVQVMPHTTDPRRFYALTRIALLPSLCPENQPLVAVEAMINGIPVIGSDRGGIPEALGECGFVLPLPERLTPGAPVEPEAFEVAPWVEAIVRLWDDRGLYEEHSDRARREALRWHPDRVRPLYAGFFGNIGLRDRAASGLVRTRIPDRGFKIQDSGFKIAEGGDRIAEGGLQIQDSGTVRDAGRAGPAFPSGPSAVRSRRRAAAREPSVAVLARDALGRGAHAPGLATGSVEEDAVPLSFAVCISETTILDGNLLASPCLADGSPHELIKVLNAPSAADGLNAALRRAKEPWMMSQV